MDLHLVLAYKLTRIPQRPATAFFSSPLSKQALENLFAPWRWLTVKKDGDTSFAAPPSCRVVTEQYKLRLDSGFPDSGTDLDFVHEISHHDFEIGGKNEWDGAPTRHSASILRMLSATHCRDYFPVRLLQHLQEKRLRLQRPLEVLDVGCGPISCLRWGALSDLLTITGLDPLIEVYQIVLGRHGLLALPHIVPDKIIADRIENLNGSEYRGAYDLIYSNNALDHVQDIRAAMGRLACALSPGGTMYVQVFTNEGTRQNWYQLHKHDIDVDGKALVATKETGERIRLAGPDCSLAVREIVHHSQDCLAVLLSKH